MSPTVRSIFAVLDGFLLFLALEGVFYALAFLGLHQSFDTPTQLYLFCNLLWAVASALAAGYTTGRVAGRSPVTHGVVLAIPFVILSLYNLNKGIGSGHNPYVLGFAVLVPLALVAGSYIVAHRFLGTRALTNR